jgi:hypothetical protein
MQIAQQKKENNIAEYILYMWQLEDIIRANNFDDSALNKLLVEPLSVDKNTKAQIDAWYRVLIDKMKAQKLDKAGHLSELTELIIELKYLHDTLLNVLNDKAYEKLYLSSKLNIDALRIKSGATEQNDISVCLNGLYGLLLLRLKKQEISSETTEAMLSISRLIAYLASKYKTINKAN